MKKYCVLYKLSTEKMCSLSNLSHFQSIHGGGFFRKEKSYEQTTRLSGYVRVNSATNGK